METVVEMDAKGRIIIPSSLRRGLEKNGIEDGGRPPRVNTSP
ncbi:hypothetical protein KEJ51_02905 [Candidatus Bathyarchaeota archaeon]|nr:hypothetical protein [Candidatus Bathyarchaeota archaeon]